MLAGSRVGGVWQRRGRWRMAEKRAGMVGMVTAAVHARSRRLHGVRARISIRAQSRTRVKPGGVARV